MMIVDYYIVVLDHSLDWASISLTIQLPILTRSQAHKQPLPTELISFELLLNFTLFFIASLPHSLEQQQRFVDFQLNIFQ